jgi:hypothetical protein
MNLMVPTMGSSNIRQVQLRMNLNKAFILRLSVHSGEELSRDLLDVLTIDK